MMHQHHETPAFRPGFICADPLSVTCLDPETRPADFSGSQSQASNPSRFQTTRRRRGMGTTMYIHVTKGGIL